MVLSPFFFIKKQINQIMYKIFKVSSNEITHGNNLMAGNTDIVSWTDDLSSLIDGRGMFSGCSNLETFTSDLSSLEIRNS